MPGVVGVGGQKQFPLVFLTYGLMNVLRLKPKLVISLLDFL
jgi:hypothetical protein